MHIIAVDDEPLALQNILSILSDVVPEADVKGFQNPEEALLYLEQNPVDIALLDIEMGNMDGITLAKRCKDIQCNINIIFVTAHSKYTMDALRLHASGYLVKPVRRRDMMIELNDLRYPFPKFMKNRVRVQTFGNFQIFVEEQALHFPMAKCKECLAYLIDRKGAFVTTGELAAVLWEDLPYDKTVQNNTHRVISDLRKTLKQAGAEQILIKKRREMCVNIEAVECDYYQFLKGDVANINAFHGEYMSNYSWAEFTLSTLKNEK